MKHVTLLLFNLIFLVSCSKTDFESGLIEEIVGENLNNKTSYNIVAISLDGCIYCHDHIVEKVNSDQSIDGIILFSRNKNATKIFSKNLNKNISVFYYTQDMANTIFFEDEIKILLLRIEDRKILKKEKYEIFG